MPLLAVEELSVRFGARTLFEDDFLSIEPRERLGIVGPNGTGKSTLLKILAGRMKPDGGRRVCTRGTRVDYLGQELETSFSGTVFERVMKAAPGRDDVTTALETIQTELEAAETTEAQLELSERLAGLHEKLADLDQRFGEHEARRILHGLGFEEADCDQPLSTFSGGWRMRAELAALLFAQPDVLLLDEPTNHLDMPSVRWLSRFLQASKHAIVMTCHDREFLNAHVNRVASLEIEGMRSFRGNYDEYLTQRSVELEYLMARAKKDEQRKKDLEAFVTRFKAQATKARQAQSKAKLIEKLKANQVDLPKLRKNISIRFKPVARSGEWVLRTEQLEHGFTESQTLFADLNLSVRRGERIAIVGKNGAGKTTLLRLAAQELNPRAGVVRLGHNVKLSYFAQHHADVLTDTNTVLDEVYSANRDLTQTEIRSICGAFLFSGDDVDKPISVLSGGEKTRVALAKILANPGNVLLLDEPTNHLDIESADRLTASLESYDGTLIFVSHNLDFARRLSTAVWDVKPGRVENFPGQLSDYLAALDAAEAGTAPKKEKVRPVKQDRAERIAAREADKRKSKEAKKKQRVLEGTVARLEKEIAALEVKKREHEATLADPETHEDGGLMRITTTDYAHTQKALQDAEDAWAEAQEALERLNAD